MGGMSPPGTETGLAFGEEAGRGGMTAVVAPGDDALEEPPVGFEVTEGDLRRRAAA